MLKIIFFWILLWAGDQSKCELSIVQRSFKTKIGEKCKMWVVLIST